MNDEAFHLTPVDARRYDFGSALRGYDKARVDQFRDQVADELERLMRVNQELEAKAKGFHEQLRAFRERDKALNDALISAQQLRAETREQADREAQLILREARAEGERLIGEARSEVRRLRAEHRRARAGAAQLSRADAHDGRAPAGRAPGGRTGASSAAAGPGRRRGGRTAVRQERVVARRARASGVGHGGSEGRRAPRSPRGGRARAHGRRRRGGHRGDSRAHHARARRRRSSSAPDSARSARAIEVEARIEYGDIPGFPLSTVESHAVACSVGTLGGTARGGDAGALPPLRGLHAAAGHLPGARAARARRADAASSPTPAAACTRCGRPAT